ncbi:MAG: virulence RhuM family protein [Methylococcales symbiont of Iophon sp. n. MRB-2018]|nr:MAG: virulence RhuM family protein [Methylococcales symbiont of Iophon sp. n. MRB-2018]
MSHTACLIGFCLSRLLFPLTMGGFSQSVDKFLDFNDFKILDGFGHISHQKAKEKAYLEYDEFNKTQKINSDFDKSIKKLKNKIK